MIEIDLAGGSDHGLRVERCVALMQDDLDQLVQACSARAP
jgi:hypothetical protein